MNVRRKLVLFHQLMRWNSTRKLKTAYTVILAMVYHIELLNEVTANGPGRVMLIYWTMRMLRRVVELVTMAITTL